MASTKHMLYGTIIALLACGPVHSVPYDIKPGPISYVINNWAKQSRIWLIYSSSITKPDYLIDGLVGDYEPEYALKVLLSQTCLRYELVNDHTVTIDRGGDQCAWIVYPGGFAHCIPVIDRREWAPCLTEP